MNPETREGPHTPHPVRSVAIALAVTALDAALLAAALGGVPALIAHPRALALLAAWGTGAVVLAILRPVRGHGAVAVDADPWFVLVALFLLPLATAPTAAFGERLGLWRLPGGAALAWTGVLISGAGLAVRIAAMAQLGPRFSPVVAVQREHTLETGGLYARIRHPGYLGAWLASFGAALAFGTAFALPLAAAMALLLHNRTRREEAMLERHFGEEYRRYRSHTGRFLPRLAPSRVGEG